MTKKQVKDRLILELHNKATTNLQLIRLWNILYPEQILMIHAKNFKIKLSNMVIDYDKYGND